MKELQRTDRLLIATGIFILILVIGLLLIRPPYLEFSRSLAQSAADAQNPSVVVNPPDIKGLLEQGSGSILLVDIRNVYDYGKGHFDNAIHLPKVELLDEKNIKMFEEAAKANKTIILYGNDQLNVTGPAMLLRDLGFEDIKILPGGYYLISSYLSGGIATADNFNGEKPAYKFSEMVSASASSQPNESAPAVKPEVVRPAKKAKGKAEGGC
jgi:rhodanese-related sulfurtransferase